MTTHGAVHWNELMTNDIRKAKDFYAKTLGWTYDDMPMPNGTYTIAKSGGQMVGGLFDMAASGIKGMPDVWFTYFAVDDLDAALGKLKAAGGKVTREPWEAPGVGRMAMVVDNSGAMLSLMTPAPPA